MKKLVLFALLILITIPLCVSAGQRIVVVANSIDYANAADFVKNLDSKGRPVLHVGANELDAHNLEKFIVILGGPDAPDGIGVQVRALLSETDMDYLREKHGNKKMFLKTNVWSKGQIVMIIAGNHRNDTQQATLDNEGNVHTEMTEDKSAILSSSTAKISLAIEDFNYSLNTSNGFWFFKWVDYSLTHNGESSISPMIDVELFRKIDGAYERVYLNTNVTHFDEQFEPKDMWYDTYSEDVKLKNGWHKLVVRLRDGADSAIIKEDSEEFLI
ncbi:MAG: hypothetical protein ABIF92_02770 [archaeon]